MDGLTHNLTDEQQSELSMPLGSTTSSSISDQDTPNSMHQFAKQGLGSTISSGQPGMDRLTHNLTNAVQSEPTKPLGSTISSSYSDQGTPSNTRQSAKQHLGWTISSGQSDMDGQTHNITDVADTASGKELRANTSWSLAYQRRSADTSVSNMTDAARAALAKQFGSNISSSLDNQHTPAGKSLRL